MGDGLQDNYGLKYDHRNLLTEISRLISENETELTRYYYDETGNRVRKLVMRNWSGGGGIPDPPNWDDIGNLPIYEPEGEGGDGWSIYKNEFYVRGVGGNTIAEYDWETLKQWNVYGTDNVGKITKDGEEENKYYYLKDHLGSIRAVIDEDNNCVSAQDYDMWDYLLENRTFDIEREKYKFTSKERDEESNYDYFGARYYMSRIGRWGSIDPLFEKHFDFSPYNYVLDNPLKLIDPDGMQVDATSNSITDKILNNIISDILFITGYKIGRDESGNLGIVEDYGDINKSKNAREIVEKLFGENPQIKAKLVIDESKPTKYYPKGKIISLNPGQINAFIGGIHNVDERTMGWGMNFFHEALHPLENKGDKLKDKYDTGPIVDIVNTIRQEIGGDDFGGDWGLRCTYHGFQFEGSKDVYVPFRSTDVTRIRRGQEPLFQYIKVNEKFKPSE